MLVFFTRCIIPPTTYHPLAILVALEGRELSVELGQAVTLMAHLVGQDLQEGEDGVFRIARRVAKDRIISTVDPDARHGHKTSARGFDGYKGHVAIDPDSELITSTALTAGNVGDGAAAADLLADELPAVDQEQPVDQQPGEQPAEPSPASSTEQPAEERLSVYGDSAYGSGEFLDTLQQADAEVNCKVQPPVAPGGRFSKDAFEIDLQAGTVSCPAGHTVDLRAASDGQIAQFAQVCADCPLAAQCTTSKSGRTVYVEPRIRRRRRDATPSAA
jgi:hypothetical protein